MSKILVEFGRRVKRLRGHMGISQEQFAFKCHLHRTYISDIERGVRNVSLENLEKIARSFDMSVSKLLDFKEV